MKPLNQVERNNTFLQFLLLFMVTIAVIFTVIFFSFDVPEKENKRLQQTISALEKEKTATGPFKDAMKSAMEELYNYNPAIDNPIAKKRKVKLKIYEMEKLLGSMPEGENAMYGLIVENLANLNEAKAKLRQEKYE